MRYAPGVVDRQSLSDEPAHRPAEDVGLDEAERLHQVRGGLSQRVEGPAAPGSRHADARIVEEDQAVSARQQAQQRRIPFGHRRAGARQHQQRRSLAAFVPGDPGAGNRDRLNLRPEWRLRSEALPATEQKHRQAQESPDPGSHSAEPTRDFSAGEPLAPPRLRVEDQGGQDESLRAFGCRHRVAHGHGWRLVGRHGCRDRIFLGRDDSGCGVARTRAGGTPAGAQSRAARVA